MGYSAGRLAFVGVEVLRLRLMVDVVCVEQPQASWEKRSMEHYAGLDVSVKETSVCIIDETGRICREVKVVSHPEDLLAVLCNPAWRLDRIGLEAGPLSQWLFSGLAEAGIPAICIETRHAKAFLKAQVNKSDRNDSRGIAQMMRVGLFRPVHVKTLASQKQRALLAARKILQKKVLAMENDIRGLLRNFGLKVGIVGVVGFEQRIYDLIKGVPEFVDIGPRPGTLCKRRLVSSARCHANSFTSTSLTCSATSLISCRFKKSKQPFDIADALSNHDAEFGKMGANGADKAAPLANQ
jgi:hypothetical protein